MGRNQFIVFLVLASLHARASADDVTRVSVNSAEVQGNQATGFVTISSDGRFAAFDSDANNLVPGDTNFLHDLFVRDRQLGTTQRISVSTSGAQANNASYCPMISPDGRYVVFSSYASNLVPGDTNSNVDIFVRDRQAGTTELVSVDSAGVIGNGASFLPAASADLRYVTFVSDAVNLDPSDSNQFDDIYVRDRILGTTTRINLGPGGAEADDASYYPILSADGRYVVYTSDATNLVVGDNNGFSDVFRFDMLTGTTERVSLTDGDAEAAGGSIDIGINVLSADGRFVIFASSAPNLVAGDLNGQTDVFVRDCVAGTTVRASLGDADQEPDNDSLWAAISADGRTVAFESDGSSLTPNEAAGSDVFLRDLEAGTTTLISANALDLGGNADSFSPCMSSDGRHVAFNSLATNLVPGDTNSAADAFVRSRCWVEFTALGGGVAGAGGYVPLAGGENGACRSGFSFSISQTIGGAAGILFIGTAELAQSPFLGGTFHIDLASPFVAFPLVMSGAPGLVGAGSVEVSGADASAFAGVTLVLQFAAADTAAFAGVALSNGLRMKIDS